MIKDLLFLVVLVFIAKAQIRSVPTVPILPTISNGPTATPVSTSSSSSQNCCGTALHTIYIV
jgi:hypothetical protein